MERPARGTLVLQSTASLENARAGASPSRRSWGAIRDFTGPALALLPVACSVSCASALLAVCAWSRSVGTSGSRLARDGALAGLSRGRLVGRVQSPRESQSRRGDYLSPGPLTPPHDPAGRAAGGRRGPRGGRGHFPAGPAGDAGVAVVG